MADVIVIQGDSDEETVVIYSSAPAVNALLLQDGTNLLLQDNTNILLQ